MHHCHELFTFRSIFWKSVVIICLNFLMPRSANLSIIFLLRLDLVSAVVAERWLRGFA